VYRRAAAGLALEPALVDDGVTMVSELAANTLHIHRDHQAQPVRQRRSSRSAPELWLYLRGSGTRRELVCKIFDSYPGWLHGNVPGRGYVRAPADAESGRGLEVVHELSQGRWGHHPTRSRLAGWDVRGKAVWFAVPVGAAENMLIPPVVNGSAVPERYVTMTAAQAMTELEDGLAARGFGGRMVRADDQRADMAVLSVCSGVTVWCRAGMAWLRAPGLNGQRWNYSDLVEVAEQTVQAYETLTAKGDRQPLADAARTWALPHYARLARAGATRVPSRATRTYAVPRPRSGLRRYQSPRLRSG
jgi:hypothetical protein